MSKFDAAIEAIEYFRKYPSDEDEGERMNAAIRVLEAAGKVDKLGTSVVIQDLDCIQDQGVKSCRLCEKTPDDCYIKQVLSLLEALPEKEPNHAE